MIRYFIMDNLIFDMCNRLYVYASVFLCLSVVTSKLLHIFHAEIIKDVYLSVNKAK